MKEIKPGIYEHFKGAHYKVIGVGKHTETLEALVIYHPVDETGKLYVRPKDMFVEQVSHQGKDVPRFKYLKEE